MAQQITQLKEQRQPRTPPTTTMELLKYGEDELAEIENATDSKEVEMQAKAKCNN